MLHAPYFSDMVPPLLPGADLIEKGVADLACGEYSIEALLVSIGAPRLRTLGWSLPVTLEQPELRLYMLLAESNEDGAHGRYNGLVRRLVSFERAAACAR